MHTTFEAGLIVIGQSLDMLRSAVDDMPDNALDWTPVSGMSSMAVLAMHATSATRFFSECSSGRIGSRDDYRATIRAAAFRTKGVTGRDLHTVFDRLVADVAELLTSAGDVELAAVMPWKDDFDRNKTGAECLIMAVGHLREHVGHAQMLHDLWLAGSREGR